MEVTKSKKQKKNAQSESLLAYRIHQYLKKLNKLSGEVARLEYLIIRLAAFLMLVALGSEIVTQQVGGITKNVNLHGLRRLLPAILIALGFFVVVISVITLFVVIFKSRTKEVLHVRKTVVKAFSHALDRSSFNPHLLERKNEQPSP